MGCVLSSCTKIEVGRSRSLHYSYNPDGVDSNVVLKSYRQNVHFGECIEGGEEKCTYGDEILVEDIIVHHAATTESLSGISPELYSLDQSMIPCPGSRSSPCDTVDVTDMTEDTESENVLAIDHCNLSLGMILNGNCVVGSESAAIAQERSESAHAGPDRIHINDNPADNGDARQSYANAAFDGLPDDIEEEEVVVNYVINDHQR